MNSCRACKRITIDACKLIVVTVANTDLFFFTDESFVHAQVKCRPRKTP